MNLLIFWSTVAFTVSTITYFILLIPVITSHLSVTCAIFSLFDVVSFFFFKVVLKVLDQKQVRHICIYFYLITFLMYSF